eukprot:scaffold7461_cov76-Skeletonema_dohrnii-CCMP3373.AAC.2
MRFISAAVSFNGWIIRFRIDRERVTQRVGGKENTTDEFSMQPQQKWCGYYQVLDGTGGYERNWPRTSHTKTRSERKTTDEFSMQPKQKWCGYYKVLDGTGGYERVKKLMNHLDDIPSCTLSYRLVPGSTRIIFAEVASKTRLSFFFPTESLCDSFSANSEPIVEPSIEADCS